jgi:hypothetical protein
MYTSRSTTAQFKIKTVYRPSIYHGTHRWEDKGFNPMVVRFEKPPKCGIPMGAIEVNHYLSQTAVP